MGRPPLNGVTPKFTLRLDTDVRRQLAKQAAGERRTLGNLISSILTEHAEETMGILTDESDMRKRINITISPELHNAAKTHARVAHGADFSGLVSKLILDDMSKTYLQESPHKMALSAHYVADLKARTEDEERRRMSFGPREVKTKVTDPLKSRSKKPEIIAAKKAAQAARTEVDLSRRKAAERHS